MKARVTRHGFMKGVGVVLAVGALVAALRIAVAAQAEPDRRLRVAVVTADLEAIVRHVGGGDVVTTSLFRGCLLRKGLEVEAGALDHLLTAEAVVWTGFFGESAAIHAAVERLPAARETTLSQPLWIDVSRDAARVNVPSSSCDGFVEIQFMNGDPFFWLNPENGAIIARNVAAGLGRLRPDRSGAYAANADGFALELAGNIQRWRSELAALAGVKVFVAQCGWANLARLGGPTIITCRTSPGTLSRADLLAEQINAQDVQIVVVDPNTPPEYSEVFRARTRARVVTVPSSIADLPGARSYAALFDNMVERLREAKGKT